jgi:hypothetical protein
LDKVKVDRAQDEKDGWQVEESVQKHFQDE